MIMEVNGVGEMKREAESGIDVLVVGAGLGGLFAAMELYRQGHSVRVIEGKEGIEGLGDFIGIVASVTRHFENYPGMAEMYRKLMYKPSMYMHKYDGEFLGGPFMDDAKFDRMPKPIPRPRLISLLHSYVNKLGIPITFGKQVAEYYENLEGGKSGAITVDGEHIEADLVVAADGVASRSWRAVSGTDVKARSSGFSVYRVVYPTKLAINDPIIRERFDLQPDGNDICRVWLGKNTHAIALMSQENLTWFLTHKDHGQAAELWDRRIDASDVINNLDKDVPWDNCFMQIMRLTPPKSVVDYKILWRNPNTKWASDGGLIIQLGDSAHSFLPTSANGATQAMEDGISLAACLRLAGKNNIALATRVHTCLRFQRVACAQRSGFKNREVWHHTDFEEAKKHPEKLVAQVGKWINQHNPETYVYENWSKCVNHLVAGVSFQNTNIPPGYTYEPWTIDELLDASKEGRQTVDPGEWY